MVVIAWGPRRRLVCWRRRFDGEPVGLSAHDGVALVFALYHASRLCGWVPSGGHIP